MRYRNLLTYLLTCIPDVLPTLQLYEVILLKEPLSLDQYSTILLEVEYVYVLHYIGYEQSSNVLTMLSFASYHRGAF